IRPLFKSKCFDPTFGKHPIPCTTLLHFRGRFSLCLSMYFGCDRRVGLKSTLFHCLCIRTAISSDPFRTCLTANQVPPRGGYPFRLVNKLLVISYRAGRTT